MATIRSSIDLPTAHGTVQIVTFDGLCDEKEHFAIGVGAWRDQKVLNLRIHSECLTGDLLSSSKCDCGDQLQESICDMSKLGGVILYLRQEGRGIGLYNKIDAYALQQQGLDTVEANAALGFQDDLRDYTVAAQMLEALGFLTVRLKTNNPKKIAGIRNYGIEVVERVPTGIYAKKENTFYLRTKAEKSGHLITVGC